MKPRRQRPLPRRIHSSADRQLPVHGVRHGWITSNPGAAASSRKYEAGQDIDLDLQNRRRCWPKPWQSARTASMHSGCANGPLRSSTSRRDIEARVALSQTESIRELGAIAIPIRRSSCTGTRHLKSRWTASGPGTRPGTRCFPAPPLRNPASTALSPTSRSCLAYIAAMGFDVLYLPPIHPIGTTERKGPNNNPEARAGDPGSPWAIGGARGRTQGHPSGAGHARGFPTADRQRPASTGSRSRWTSRSSARPIIPMSASIPSGFSSAPTARSSTPRIRPRSTRTSIRSTSSPRTGEALATELRERGRILDLAGGAHLPRRQSAHQAVCLLGGPDRGKSVGCGPMSSSWPRHSPAPR